MAYRDRVALYKQIADRRGNPLIAYVTSQRPFATGLIASDSIDELIDQIETIDKTPETDIDLYLESNGGDALTSWRLVSLLRASFRKVNVLIPHSAFSAATLLALGADEIVMGPYAALGPIDPQITTRKQDGTTQQFGYEDVASFLRFVREEGGLTEQQYVKDALEKLCEVVEPTALGFAKRSSSLSISVGEKMLQMHMTSAEEKSQAHSIAVTLNRSFFSHGHALGRIEAKDIGLNVVEADSQLEKLMWQIHLDFDVELETKVPFDPLAQYLRDPQAAPFLQSPPPLYLPPQQVNPQITLQLLQNYINQQLNVTLPTVGFELKYALMESERTASEYYAEGEILVQRTLDMQFNGNMVVLNKGWRKLAQPQAVPPSSVDP